MKHTPKLDAETWVDHYGDALFHFALARVNDREAAEDLVQDTFVSAMKSREHFQGRSSEKTWLIGILKHKVIDHYRKDRSKMYEQVTWNNPGNPDGFFQTNGSWHDRPQHWRTNPGKAQEVKEFLDHFYQCLADLPQRSADVFVYREMDGLSTAEICDRLKITSRNCWVILYRARILLRKCLEVLGLSRQKKGVSK